jgi:beta-lactamase class A
MHRRGFSALAFATLAGMKAMRPASAEDASGDLQTQLQRFKEFPGVKSWRLDVDDDRLASKSPGKQLFTASTIKTFIVCQYLRDVEAGRLSEDEQLTVNDLVRNSDSPVFLNLTGTTPGRSALEAAITHSDNTATDIALLHVGPDRVRSLIAAAGLRSTLIPDSTRRFFSYNVGAPLGEDWLGGSAASAGLATTAWPAAAAAQ